MKRRDFLVQTSAVFAALHLPFSMDLLANEHLPSDIIKELQITLKNWCDGMLVHQINAPTQPEKNGAFWCPACQTIHGRCFEAVYPLLYMFEITGDKKYLEAGVNAFQWSKNVSHQDGSFTVMPDPSTWKGISVFGATALAETLKYQRHLLPESVVNDWKLRLKQVGSYIHDNFDMTFTNINYGFSAVYALLLMGEVLENEKFIKRSETLASEIKNWLTQPNELIFGEGKPSDLKSPKGLNAVDLGYNVEETLNGAVLYAVEKKDNELIQLLQKSLEGHLEFMLPDGGWDNSWGTRQYKWSYWGSRTTDGCQPAYTALAHLNPAFGRAAFQNLELLKQCTNSGLIHGGLHFVSHGIKPCIHHTFCHTKSITTILNTNVNLNLLSGKAKLPRELNYNPKFFREIDVWLMNENEWKATISGYDFIYKKHAQQVTGGAIGMLFHEKAGVLLSGSMAKYQLVEEFNQQKIAEKDYALTPRIECFENGIWYTNLYDTKAKLSQKENQISAEVSLVDEDQNSLIGINNKFEIGYSTSKKGFMLTAKSPSILDKKTLFTMPIVSKSDEKITLINDKKLSIKKDNCTVEISSNVPFLLSKDFPKRVFNLVPGFEALPISVSFDNQKELFFEIKVS